MEALTISEANLDIIEKNLGTMARELGGVVHNVSDVNEHVNEVENKVEDLNHEIKNLIKDIKETTIITNARQTIMYNNEQIEKKYGYYDHVRRNTLSILDACMHSNIRISSLIKLRDNVLLNNPSYWLANALCALTSWILNDKENAVKEMNNALNKDDVKTSLFFSLVYLKIGRRQTSLNWLNKYLSLESPLSLDKSFVTVLDLVSLGLYGDDAKRIILQKIDGWFKILNNENTIKNKQIDTWYDYFNSCKKNDIILPVYRLYGTESNILEENIGISNVYRQFNEYLDSVLLTDSSIKGIDDVLYDLIYEYEGREHEFQKDNLMNQLIIDCNGDREEAIKLYKKQEEIYNNKTDLLSLFTSIVLYKDNYKVSDATRKIALTYTKDYIQSALNKFGELIIEHDYQIQVGDFTTTSKDGSNMEDIKKEIDSFLGSKFDMDDKDLLLILIIMNIIGIIGIFITLNHKLLCFLVIAILIIGNILLFSKLSKRGNLRNYEKNKLGNQIYSTIDQILAEIVDYTEVMKMNQESLQQVTMKLNNSRVTDFMASNGERNIDVGE